MLSISSCLHCRLALRRVSRDLVGIRVDIATADADDAGADDAGADAGVTAAAASSPAAATSATGASSALALTPSKRTVKSPRASVTFGVAATAGAEQPAAPADAGHATSSAAAASTAPSTSATAASSADLPADEPVMKRAGSRMQQSARFTEFDYMQIIGHGDFGLVVRVREKATGTAYAMKIIDKMRALNKVCWGNDQN